MDPNFPRDLAISPSTEDGSFAASTTSSAFGADAQTTAIQRYGIAGRVWEAAYILLRYFHELDSSVLEPPFHLPAEPMTVVELGAGMGVTGFMLAERLLALGRQEDRIILTDLPEVCDLLQENLRLQESLRSADVIVTPLAWGNAQHAKDVLDEIVKDGRAITHIVCSDLVYFPELLAPLLRSLLELTSSSPSPLITISYKIRSLAKETAFWNAFGLWFTFEPVFVRGEAGWTRFGEDADASPGPPSIAARFNSPTLASSSTLPTAMAPISLRSTRYPELELRTATLDDVAAVREVFGNPANTEYDPVVSNPAKFTVERVEGMIQRWEKSQQEEKPGAVSIVVVVDGAVQGVGGMGHIATDKETGKRTGDAGVMLNAVARKKGYGAEAMRLTTDYAFDVMKLDKVTATMLAKNEPMVNLMKKMGWKGRLIPAEEGEWGEEWMFTMMPEEWAEMRKAGTA
ncbi:unnamed protein product [Peniophora sp. CBMAI 1063]|nr:unnamed protein product [Peniophora sp. CBMAI 1063]